MLFLLVSVIFEVVLGLYLTPEEISVFNASGVSLHANGSMWWADKDSDEGTEVMTFPSEPVILSVPECLPEGKNIEWTLQGRLIRVQMSTVQ